MALSLANVELTDTFNTWRVRTNSVIGEAASISASATQVFTANVQAPFFVGDGSQLTNAGSTVATDGGANRDLSVVFTGVTSGTMTTANVSSTLTFNPSTGTLTATAFSGDGSNLTNAGSTVATQTSGAAELRVTFTGIATGTMTTANVDPKLTYNPGSERLTANTVKVSNLQDSSGRTLTIRDAANTIVWGG